MGLCWFAGTRRGVRAVLVKSVRRDKTGYS